MKASAPDLLREAVRDQHPNETFEKALGRIVRNHQGTFQDYMDLVAKVRARAKREGSSQLEAAGILAAEDEPGGL